MSICAPADTRKRLQTLLAECLSCAKLLKSILADERTSLQQQDTAMLASTAALKDDAVQKLATLERHRGQIAKDAGIGATPNDMQTLLVGCDESSTLASRWQEFSAVLKECHAMNSVNGAVILARRQQVLAGLALLRGSETNADTYEIQGTRSGVFNGRELAEA
jgi:flagellar biosynthesis/type III secretory pathway chaperone